ncbi:MAG: hypothetical protein R3E53_14420 [Myxococcota bacterium]
MRGHWSGRGDALDAIQTVTDFFEREFRLRTADLLRVLRRP